jgi:hypothetical protein
MFLPAFSMVLLFLDLLAPLGLNSLERLLSSSQAHLGLKTFFFIKFLLYSFWWEGGGGGACECWWPEDYLQELVLSFHPMGPRD